MSMQSPESRRSPHPVIDDIHEVSDRVYRRYSPIMDWVIDRSRRYIRKNNGNWLLQDTAALVAIGGMTLVKAVEVFDMAAEVAVIVPVRAISRRRSASRR
jgi:hypothetical protein